MKTNIKKTKNEFTIVDKEKNAKITITSTNEDKITIYDDEVLNKVINDKFNDKYKKLLYLVMSISEDEDATDTDIDLALSKVDSFKLLFLNKYFKYIDQNKIDKYLRKIEYLEDNLDSKRTKGRGR